MLGGGGGGRGGEGVRSGKGLRGALRSYTRSGISPTLYFISPLRVLSNEYQPLLEMVPYTRHAAKHFTQITPEGELCILMRKASVGKLSHLPTERAPRPYMSCDSPQCVTRALNALRIGIPTGVKSGKSLA